MSGLMLSLTAVHISAIALVDKNSVNDRIAQLSEILVFLRETIG